METQSYKEAVGPGGDTSEPDDPGQVIHQSLSFLMCAMSLIPDLCQLNELKHVKGSSEGLKQNTVMPATYPPSPHRGPRRPWPHSGDEYT